ncbi:MAG: VanZ family protein [Mycobacteriales bacterium]|nr:VanZ family protein [Mycobacteriales bacterium]
MDRRTAALAAAVLLSLYVLFAPDPGGAPRFTGADKVVHVVLFALLAATARWRCGGRLPVWLAVAAYAVVSELVQGLLLVGRSGDPLDVVADLLGAGLGWWSVRVPRGPEH